MVSLQFETRKASNLHAYGLGVIVVVEIIIVLVVDDNNSICKSRSKLRDKRGLS